MFRLNRAMVCAQNPALYKRCYPMHPSHGNMGWHFSAEHHRALMGVLISIQS